VTARSHFLQIELAFERVKDHIVNITRSVQMEQFRSSSGDRGENHSEVFLLSSIRRPVGPTACSWQMLCGPDVKICFVWRISLRQIILIQLKFELLWTPYPQCHPKMSISSSRRART
jgi:hypothetical protein